MKVFGYTTSGPRKNNEDYFAIENIGESDFYCVADGVGGSLCGEFASKFCVETFVNNIKLSETPNLRSILQTVNEKLILESLHKKECKGMATTFTGVYIKESFVQFIHTGDSRLYLLRGNGLKQLTTDHTEVRRLLNEGLLTREQSGEYSRKNVLESALGSERELKIDYYWFEYQSKDRLVISTDGFHGILTKVELRDLSIVNSDFDSLCSVLVNSLIKRPLIDNATFVIVEL